TGESVTGTGLGSYFFATHLGSIFREEHIDPDGATAGMASAFVDTKDFSFDNPQSNDFYDRIQLDWEPLVNSSTDSVQVCAYVREELIPSGFVGSPTLETDLSSNFVSLGTLTGSNRQLKINQRGRYARFRFQAMSGRVRIRGFSIRRQRGSDRTS